MMKTVPFFALALALGCGASTTIDSGTTPDPEPVETQSSEPDVVVEGQLFEGPFADWTEICGEPTEQEGRYARCTTRVHDLNDGPFVKIATYFEGDPGNARFALKTSAGWFLASVPTGDNVMMRGHHSPAGSSVDVGSSSFANNVLKVVVRGGSSSFIPGQGAFGSSSSRWTRVHECQLNDRGVVCNDGEVVWREHCQASPRPAAVGPETPGPTRTCQETGTDVARL